MNKTTLKGPPSNKIENVAASPEQKLLTHPLKINTGSANLNVSLSYTNYMVLDYMREIKKIRFKGKRKSYLK